MVLCVNAAEGPLPQLCGTFVNCRELQNCTSLGLWQFLPAALCFSYSLTLHAKLPAFCILQYGEEALKEGMGGGGGGGGGMADLFDILSGGGGGRRGQPRERKSEDVVHRLSVSLEELYNGVTK
jgi:hypothetical protein